MGRQLLRPRLHSWLETAALCELGDYGRCAPTEAGRRDPVNGSLDLSVQVAVKGKGNTREPVGSRKERGVPAT